MKRKSHTRQPRSAVPHRVAKRPTPDEWQVDELLTLPEAAALFWPDGPLTTTSLRTAVRDRQLEVAIIAGKFLTTKAAIHRMSACKILKNTDRCEPEEIDNAPPRSVAELRRRLSERATLGRGPV